MPRTCVKKCYVKGCIKSPMDIAFRFPTNEVRCQIWLERCGNESLYHLNTKQLAQRHVCGKHFARHAFTNELRNRLNFDAVPSIFLHNSSVISRNDNNIQVTEITEENEQVECPPLPSSASVEEIPRQETESTEGIMQEECYYLPVPTPENTEVNSYEEALSFPLNPRVKDVKASNCSSKEIPHLCEEPQNAKNIKQYSNKNNHKRNFRLPSITDGKNILVAERCSVKSVDLFKLCGSTGCNDGLYSDEKNVKHLVRCSSKCGRFFHLACTGLSSVEYEILCNNDALRWFCVECRMSPIP